MEKNKTGPPLSFFSTGAARAESGRARTMRTKALIGERDVWETQVLHKRGGAEDDADLEPKKRWHG